VAPIDCASSPTLAIVKSAAPVSGVRRGVGVGVGVLVGSFGVGVAVGVGERVGVEEEVGERVGVGLKVGEPVGVGVTLGVVVCVVLAVGVGVELAPAPGVSVGVAVALPVGVSVGVAVAEPVGVAVADPVAVAVAEPVGVAVADPVGVAVADPVGVAVAEPVAVAVAEPVAVAVAEPVAVAVAEPVGVAVAVTDTVGDGVAVAVAVAVAVSVGVAVDVGVELGGSAKDKPTWLTTRSACFSTANMLKWLETPVTVPLAESTLEPPSLGCQVLPLKKKMPAGWPPLKARTTWTGRKSATGVPPTSADSWTTGPNAVPAPGEVVRWIWMVVFCPTAFAGNTTRAEPSASASDPPPGPISPTASVLVGGGGPEPPGLEGREVDAGAGGALTLEGPDCVTLADCPGGGGGGGTPAVACTPATCGDASGTTADCKPEPAVALRTARLFSSAPGAPGPGPPGPPGLPGGTAGTITLANSSATWLPS
jgi:hypothetical protein